MANGKTTLHLLVLVIFTFVIGTSAELPSHLVPIFSRAGGAPSANIDSCDVKYPLVSPWDLSSPQAALRPKYGILSKYLIYSYDLPLQGDDASSADLETLFTQCLERCNGLRQSARAANNGQPVKGECQSAFMAYNMPSLAKYGDNGGTPVIGCRLFKKMLSRNCVTAVRNGSFTNAIIGNIASCE